MFDRFSERARRVMVLAKESAIRLAHGHLGTEHLLFGLLEEGSGVGANVLRNLGVSLKRLRAEVTARIAPGPPAAPGASLPFTPGAKRALELAVEEALELGHARVGTEHLLLGLLRERHGTAAHALGAAGVELEALRRAVLAFVRPAPGPATGGRAELRVTVGHEGPMVGRPMVGRRMIGSAGLHFALDPADASLTWAQRHRLASELQARIDAWISQLPPAEVVWHDTFEITAADPEQLTAKEASTLIAEHLVLPGITVAGPPVLHACEVGQDLARGRYLCPLARDGKPWEEAIAIDGRTLRVPIQLELVCTRARASG